MKFQLRGILCVCLALGPGAMALAADTRPYKLGTFEAQGRTFVGAVVDDAIVIDLGAAASALRRPANTAPRDMRDLIARYDTGVRDLIVASVSAVTAQGGGARPAYAMELGKVRTLAPVIP